MAVASLTGKPSPTVVTPISTDSVAGLDRVLRLGWPQDGDLRTRDVVSRSRAKPTGLYPSWKVKRMMQWESPHERNAFVLLDVDSTVKTFNEQPVVIDYVLDGVARKHYPDILVEYATGRRELWEVKPKDEASDPAVADRTALMQAQLPIFGFQYRLVMAESLATEPRLNNALTLLKYGRKPIDKVQRERIRRLIEAATTGLPWGVVRDSEFGPPNRGALCRLVLEGALSIPMEHEITDATCFARRATGTENL